MQTVIGILVQPFEEQRISLLIESMQAQKHWLTTDECLYEILQSGIRNTEKLYQQGARDDA